LSGESGNRRSAGRSRRKVVLERRRREQKERGQKQRGKTTGGS
jgi:hypothetical protein